MLPRERKKRAKLLDDNMEQILYSTIQAFSTLANPLGRTEAQILAQVIGNLAQPPTSGWLQSFLDRHGSKVALRKGKKSHKRKDLLATFDKIKTWTEDTGKVLKGLALDPSLVFNMDETRAVPATKVVSVLAHKDMTETQYNQTIDSTLYTLVSCIAADGTTLFCLYIFKRAQDKNGPRHSVYLPVSSEKRLSRTQHDYPIYIAISPSGYMNGELWQQTISIFSELAHLRQGLSRHKQALLFIDGCASHIREYTIDTLNKNNISTVYFPSNTSHVLQPCDGQPFANYKSSVSKELQTEALRASITGAYEKELSLLACIRAHTKAMTSESIKEAFKSRGIWPWAPPIALANAYRACPILRVEQAPDEVYSLILAEKLVVGLQEMFTIKPTVERKMIEVVNSPSKASTLENWKPRSRTPAMKAIAQSPLLNLSSSEEEEELTDYSESDDDTSEEEPTAPPLQPSGSSNKCSHCGHIRQNGIVPVACFECYEFWLCLSCQTNTKALQEHIKTHPETEGRRTRRRSETTISTA